MTKPSLLSCFDGPSAPRCLDPFNFTAALDDMPSLQPCEGCCVKLVRHAGTVAESVRRTCTDNLDINLFMVDHVCMTEGNTKGHMCFCEEDDCNTAATNFPKILAILLPLFLANQQWLVLNPLS